MIAMAVELACVLVWEKVRRRSGSASGSNARADADARAARASDAADSVKAGMGRLGDHLRFLEVKYPLASARIKGCEDRARRAEFEIGQLQEQLRETRLEMAKMQSTMQEQLRETRLTMEEMQSAIMLQQQ